MKAFAMAALVALGAAPALADDAYPPSLFMDDIVTMMKSSDPQHHELAKAYVSGMLSGMLWLDRFQRDEPKGQYLFCRYHSGSDWERREIMRYLTPGAMIADGQFRLSDRVASHLFIQAYFASVCDENS